MKVLEGMTTDVQTVKVDTSLKEAARLMIAAGVSGLPVVDENDVVVGIISEADFVEAEADRSWGRQRRLLDALFGDRKSSEAIVVEDAMTPDPIVIDSGSELSEAARRMTEHGVKRLPVVSPDGRLRGIISCVDIVKAFARPDEAIVDEIHQDVIRRILMLDPDSVDVVAVEGVVTVKGVVPTRSDARLLEELVSRLDGVVRCDADLSWDVDDTRGASGA